ncbi:MAG: hypothetical protein AAB681_00275 [Patescibacteria group bacterium]
MNSDYHINEQSYAENDCLEAVIRYLNNEKSDQLRAVMELKMERYACTFENSEMIFKTLQGVVKDLENGEVQVWVRIREGTGPLLMEDKELETIFIEAAEKRGVKFETITAHLS